MKTILLALLFAGLVVQSKGLRKDDDAENNDLGLEGEKRSFAFSYDGSKASVIKVNESLNSFHGGAAKRARRLLQRMTQDWDQQDRAERLLRFKAVKAVESYIRDIANARQRPTAAFTAVINLIERLKRLTPSNGHIDNIPAMFATSCLNLFGETVDPFPIYSIISKEIDNAMKENKEILRLQNLVKTSNFSYLDLKNVLNNLGMDEDKKLGTQDLAKINLYKSAFDSGFPGILKDRIQKLKTTNMAEDNNKFLTCLDLYVKLETVMQTMLIHTLSLIPQHNSSLSDDILSNIKKRRNELRDILKVLYDFSEKSKFMAYYDSADYEVMYSYSMNMHRFLGKTPKSQLSCITLDGDNVPWKWSVADGKSHPYFRKGDKDTPCKWRVASHGKWIFSIINKYDCPDGKWCNALLSFDGGDPAFVTVEHKDPELWTLIRNQYNNGYTIKPKQFCGDKCKCSLSYDGNYNGILDCSSRNTKKWRIQPGYRDRPEDDSAATNQSSGNEIED